MKYVIYKVCGTNITIASQREAVEYYRKGHDIAVLGSRDGVTWEQRALWIQ